MMKRGERKRRTTANPNYSFGFEISVSVHTKFEGSAYYFGFIFNFSNTAAINGFFSVKH